GVSFAAVCATGGAIVLTGLGYPPRLRAGRDDFDLDQERRPGQPRDLAQGRGREIARVERAAHRGPCWAPGLDAEDPRRFLHDARGCRAGGAQHVADVLVDLLGLTPPVPDAGDRAVGVVRDLTGQIQQAPTVDDHALVELTAVVLR